MEELSFKVMKMGCSACVLKVTNALQGVPALEVVSVKLGQAVVRREPAVLSDEQVIAALRSAGYEATLEVRHGSANNAVSNACHV